MTPRERFISALERKPLTGRVPHFELVFFLTMEAFRKVHPSHRIFRQWDQMEKKEQRLQLEDIADTYIMSAERFEHSAIFLQENLFEDRSIEIAEIIREKTGDKFFIMFHADPTFAIPDGNHMQDFALRLADDPDEVKSEAEAKVYRFTKRAEEISNRGIIDGFALCSDYCFNTGPFLSPRQFSEFITPYLAKATKAYKDMGYYVIKHTDGNIMPILDQLLQTEPHALHSIDPQAGVDIAEVKRLYGDRICLIGNVNCGLLDTGTDEECIESVRYSLKNGMPGYGYIFSTSNCIYTGMRLERYELMLDIWRKEGNYDN